MKNLIFFAVLFLSFTALLAVDVEEEDNVLVLTSENFGQVLEENENILIEFYAPWCGHCKSLAPEYAKAATKLKEKDSPIKLAKVDCTVHEDLAAEFQIRGYPTLKFFRNGKPVDYDGQRKSDAIVSWLENKTKKALKELKSVEEFEKFKDSADFVVVGYFKKDDSKQAKVFATVAQALDMTPFALITDKKVAKAAELEKEGVTLFTKFDDEKITFDESKFTAETFEEFIESHRYPLITDFAQARTGSVFGGKIKKFALLFANKEEESFEKLYKAFKKSAKEFKGKLVFVFADTSKEESYRVMEHFGLKEEDFPTIRLLSMEGEKEKYKPDFEGDLTSKKIIKFIKSYLEGELKPYLLSEEVPEDWDAKPVKTIVGKNFEAVAKNPEKNVFVKFYAPWCALCQEIAPIWEELGEKYKDHETIVIAKMDATVNEVEKLGLKGYPTMVLFKAGDNKEVDFDGDRTLEGLSDFLEANTVPKKEEL